MRAFPNPVKDKVTIYFSDRSNSEKTILGVYDAQGRRQTVQQVIRTTANSVILDLGRLTPGWYVVRVRQADGEKTIKILRK
jgi:hypothetical protein